MVLIVVLQLIGQTDPQGIQSRRCSVLIYSRQPYLIIIIVIFFKFPSTQEAVRCQRTAAALCSFRGFMCEIFVNLAATVNAGDRGDAAVCGSESGSMASD